MSIARRLTCADCEMTGPDHCESLTHLGVLLASADQERAAAPVGRHRADEEPDVFDVADLGDEDGYGE